MSVSLVLAAHGSGDGSPANLLVRWHAARLARRGRFREVVAAFHAGSPSFETVLGQLGARRVVVVPFFAGRGYYTDRVLPGALGRGCGSTRVSLRVTPPLGAEPALWQRIARAALGMPPAASSGVLVVGHGTPRHRRSGETTHRLAACLARRLERPAVAAFLDQDPAIESVAAKLPWDEIVVVPHLIGNGEHERVDLPRRLGVSVAADRLRILPPVGRIRGVTSVLERLALRYAATANGARRAGRGRVVLVGAGPGDRGLLTLRGQEALERADLIVHDRLVSDTILDLAPAAVPRIDVGKASGAARITQRAINALLIRYAAAGATVVRLKGGDPFVFGRGGEEAAACRAAGVPCEVVPGVTSAFAVPAAAGIPVTLRGVSQSVAVVTGRGDGGRELPFDVRAVARLDTIVVLMGREALPRIVEGLLAAGRDRDTPVACIRSGGWPEQQVVRGPLAAIAQRVDRAGLHAPIVLVVGAVAAEAQPLPPATPASRAISAIASSTVRE